MEKLNDLVELANKATSGEWNAFISTGGDGTFSIHTPDDNRKGDIVNWPGFDTANCSKSQKKANAKYIAAANPETILAIAEAFRALEQERNALASKGLELCREAAHIYGKYNLTQMPDINLVDYQTIQEFSNLASKNGYGDFA